MFTVCTQLHLPKRKYVYQTMNYYKIYCLLMLVLTVFLQQDKKAAIVIAFYNLENLYDTIDNPLVNDDEFIPNGAKQYGSAIYQDKLFKLATVINDIGTTYNKIGAALIGVAEVENDSVLYDLTRHFLLRQKRYKFIHYDSKDIRGVDVALLYNPLLFVPFSASAITVTLPGKSKASLTTRDILYTTGSLLGEQIHVFVNHWPSRRGGEERSIPARAAAATACRKHIDSILHQQPSAKIIVMGDLNDNPTDKSIRKTLRTSGSIKKLQKEQLYNPWEAHYKKGFGTIAHRDVWGLFDQIILSAAWLDSASGGFTFKHAHIYSQPFMIEPNGNFKGYPMRTWNGNQYRGGFCDHFPTYIVVER